jgi:hypothetical protein
MRGTIDSTVSVSVATAWLDSTGVEWGIVLPRWLRIRAVILAAEEGGGMSHPIPIDLLCVNAALNALSP